MVDIRNNNYMEIMEMIIRQGVGKTFERDCIGDVKMKKTKLELTLDKCNHTMELIRTVVPVLILIIQIIILFKIEG